MTCAVDLAAHCIKLGSKCCCCQCKLLALLLRQFYTLHSVNNKCVVVVIVVEQQSNNGNTYFSSSLFWKIFFFLVSPPFGFFFLFSFGTCRCCYCCWIFLDGTLKERTECCKLKLEKGAELICMYHSVCKYAFSLVLFLIAAARCCFVSSRCFCCCSLCPVLMLFNCRL